MTRFCRVLIVAFSLAVARAEAVDIHHRSDSASRQFVVYCDYAPLRYRVVSFAEEVKADVLHSLGESDRWKIPIVVTIEMETPANQGAPPVDMRLVETPGGPKIEINVCVGKNPAEVNLQKQFTRAVLLEYAYRGVEIQGGMQFHQAPWWLVEGIIQIVRHRDLGLESDLYQTLIATNKLPPISDLLTGEPGELGDTALALDQALAMCLVQLLIEQRDGRQRLARLVRDWPRANGDAAAVLKKEFPDLAPDPQTLQKWWTLGLAQFAASDRYAGLSAAGTEEALAPILRLSIAVDKSGTRKDFAPGDFKEYLKLSGSRAVLTESHGAIIALSSRAFPLYRPVLHEYEQAFALLARGKAGGVREKLAAAEKTRALVLRRTAEIADYLNWFEATQMTSKTNAFDSYLKAANELSAPQQSGNSEISRYLDDLENEF